VKHPLVNNCLSCGRIVCAQEGSGPCFFCANLVVTKEEQLVLDRKSKKSEMLETGNEGSPEGQKRPKSDDLGFLTDTPQLHPQQGTGERATPGKLMCPGL